jgi:hypothetical protein
VISWAEGLLSGAVVVRSSAKTNATQNNKRQILNILLVRMELLQKY